LVGIEGILTADPRIAETELREDLEKLVRVIRRNEDQ